MHYSIVPRHTQTMIAYKVLTEYFWKSQWKTALSAHMTNNMFFLSVVAVTQAP